MPRLAERDRLSLLLLAPWVPNWLHILQVVQPETLLRWHREGFQRPEQELAQQTPESRRLGQANVTPLQLAAVSSSSLAPSQCGRRKLIAMPVSNVVHHTYAWAT